jgi:hypothetical protein
MTSNAPLTARPLELRAAEIEAAVARTAERLSEVPVVETSILRLLTLMGREISCPEPGQYDTCRRRPVRARSDHPGCQRAGSAPHHHTYQRRRRGTDAIATARYDGSYQGNFCRHAAAGVLPARR